VRKTERCRRVLIMWIQRESLSASVWLLSPFSALTLLVRWQEGHLACKMQLKQSQ